MPQIESTLESLALMFTARDIMVDVDNLVSAANEMDAHQLLQENKNLDMIPIKTNGLLLSYLERNSSRAKKIRQTDTITELTRILDLVDVLKARRFCFVVNRSILGLIHFSDLNNHLVKIPFFVILQAFEEHLFREIGPLVNNTNLPMALSQERFATISRRMRELRKNRADLDWINLLNFEDIVKCASYFKKITLSHDELRSISNVRNRVAHADRPFISKHEDVRRLSEAKRICMSVLGNGGPVRRREN
jgi:hypothetical protein